MTFLRIWRTRVDPERLDDYDRWADKRSLPMFTKQPGFLGVVFSRTGDRAAVLTFWTDQVAIDALNTSGSYQEMVRRIGDSELLVGTTSLEIYEIHGGAVDAEALLS